MAKQWSPTQRQITEYERLVKAYNKMRRQIRKVHKAFEREDEGGRVPALVLPERHRKMSLRQIRLSGRKLFQLKLKQLRSVVKGGLKGFYKQYKASYLELYRTYIIGLDPEYNPFGNGEGFLYSEMQIKEVAIDDPNMAQFMRDYNNIVRMNPSIFAFLIKSGKIPAFKKIYEELVGSGSGASFYESFAKVMHNMVNLVKGTSAKKFEKIMSGYFDKSTISGTIRSMYKTSKGIENYLFGDSEKSPYKE